MAPARRSCSACVLLVGVCAAAGRSPRAHAGDTPWVFPDCEPGESPDAAVPYITDVMRYGRIGDITAYAVGTFSCNVGTCWLDWEGYTNRHPVIAQNMYRLKVGRFEQIGMSWVKHGFALEPEPSGCLPDCYPTVTDHMSVHCEDTYSAGINGLQEYLGPRSQVNPSTGSFPFPWSAPPAAATIGRRLQVHDADLDPALNAGALYFFETQFVTPDDATAGNDDNNATYVRTTPSGAFPNLNFFNFVSQHPEEPAIRAWNDSEGGVTETDVHVPGDGLFILAAKATSLGGGMWHYEYALHNLNSDRGAAAFRVPIDPSAGVSNIEFHDVDYHSGEPYAGTDWVGGFSNGMVSWSTTPFAVDPNANALRWGTLYNFRFDANVPPLQTEAVLGLFKPGAFDSIAVSTVGPMLAADCNNSGIGEDCDSNGRRDACQFDGDADGLPDACEPDTDADGWLDDHDNCVLSANASQADEDADGQGDACDPDYCRTAVLAHDFETDQGWTVGDGGDNAIRGIWTRVDPLGFFAQPDDDHTPSAGTMCFVTGQETPGGGGPNENDVDAGKTTLLSPVFRLCGDAEIDFWLWYYMVSSAPGEVLKIDISNDGGANWVHVETVFSFLSLWRYHRFSVRDFVAPTERMRLRFVATDTANDAQVEAALDDFQVITSVCPLDCNANAVPDACDLAAGTSMDGDANGVPDECQVPEAILTSAVSRKPHGAPAFNGDISINPAGELGVGGVTTEPRAGGITELRLAFEPPPGPGPTDSISLEAAVCGGPGYEPYLGASTWSTTVSGQELVLSFVPGLENARTYRLAFGAPITSVSRTLELRGLVGDVNSDGLVNATDRSVIVGTWTGAGFSVVTDLNRDGQTNATDRSVVVGAWTGTAGCAP